MKTYLQISIAFFTLLGSSSCSLFDKDSNESIEANDSNCLFQTGQSKLSAQSEFKISNYEYNASNRLIKCLREDGLFEYSYNYEPSGRLSEIVQKTELFGQVAYAKLEYENGASGPVRITESRSSDGVAYEEDLTFEFEYSNDRLSSSSIWDGEDQLTYNEFDYDSDSNVSQMRIFYFDGETIPTRSNHYDYTYGQIRDLPRLEYWKDHYATSSSVIDNSDKEVIQVVARNYESGNLNSTKTTNYEYTYNEDGCLIEEVIIYENGNQDVNIYMY